MSNSKPDKKEERASSAPAPFEIYPSDLWRGTVRFWWLFLAIIILCSGGTALRSRLNYRPVYKASVTFTVQTADNAAGTNGITSYSFYYNRSTASQLSSTFPYILQSNILQDIIKTDLELPYMPASLSASTVSGTNMFTMTATGSDPQLTYDVLVSAMENYPFVAEYVIGNTLLTILSAPSVPTDPVNTVNYLRQGLIGAAFGIVISAFLLICYSTMRRTVRTKKDIHEKLNQHGLGVLPQVTFKKHRTKIDRSILLTNPLIGNGFLESLRELRTSLLNLTENEAGGKVITVTSAAPGEGKTTLTVNLAAEIAASGKKVLLVDADLRNPSISALVYGKTPAPEKAEGLVNTAFVEKLGLTLLTFNVPSSKFWKLMKTEFWSQLFRDLRGEYDYIFVDTPPCALISDPAVIAEASDGVIFSVRQDTVRISRIRYAIDIISATNARVLGCVLNGASSGVSGYGYNYGYGRYGSYGRYGHYGHYGRYGYGKK